MGRKVKDVMTREVICARPSTSYQELVGLLAERHVSAVPVVDDERHVLGVVSDADLGLKHEQPSDAFQRFLLASRRQRLERLKARGGTAVELMTWPVVTVGPEADVAKAARRLRKHLIRRMPVVDPEGRLVGIVSHSDVLKIFLRADEEIRREIVDQVIVGGRLPGHEPIQVSVRDGVVLLEGACERRTLILVLTRAVAGVEGVVRVENRLGFDVDDQSTLPSTFGRPLLLALAFARLVLARCVVAAFVLLVGLAITPLDLVGCFGSLASGSTVASRRVLSTCWSPPATTRQCCPWPCRASSGRGPRLGPNGLVPPTSASRGPFPSAAS